MKIRKLVDEARILGPNDISISLLQEAVRLADSNGEIRLAFEARKILMRYARQLLRSELLAVTFTETLTRFDENAEEFPEFNPLHEYREVIGLLSNFYDITIA